ncbi:hypothetical protein [Pseudomonas sp.]|uniref:hypothetical protein n=1 Tax=Pseudomonas sp. TaxID=306 RepID=UPI001B009F70|nr:hypothetical protein [Pseudomonas sp.]MBO9552247.1 hypothetical protein [Pseudomonas sp.]
MFSVPNINDLITDQATIQEASNSIASLYRVPILAFAVRPVLIGAMMAAALWFPFGVAGIAAGVIPIVPFTWIRYRRFAKSRKTVEAEMVVRMLQGLHELDIPRGAAEAIVGLWMHNTRRGFNFDIDREIRLYDAVYSPEAIARREAEDKKHSTE